MEEFKNVVLEENQFANETRKKWQFLETADCQDIGARDTNPHTNVPSKHPLQIIFSQERP